MLIGDFYYELPKTLPTLNATSFYYVAFCFLVFCLSRPFKSIARPFVLLVADLIFVMSFGATNLYWLFSLSLMAYLLGLVIGWAKNKYLLMGSCSLYACLLFFFKYHFTFDGNYLIPLGLSFYSFKIISYFADVYKNRIAPEKNLLCFLNYVMFFPCITAGPINRYKDFLEELVSKHPFDYRDVSTGFFMMACGLFEKLVVCDFLKSVAARTSSTDLVGLGILLNIVLYSLEIYLDFDSYSNIAIGTARMFGFKFSRNFNVPYLASNIKEFWNRWHISLSTWFRDYVYFPLGGSKKGKLRQYINIMTVFLLSSLWHGLTVNYVIWGIGHGIVRIIEDKIGNIAKTTKIPSVIKLFIKPMLIVVNFTIVSCLWVFFRYENLNDAIDVFSRLFMLGGLNVETIGLTLMEIKWLCILVAGVLFCDLMRYFFDIYECVGNWLFFLRWPLYVIMILIFLVFGVYGGGAFEAGDFIYRWF